MINNKHITKAHKRFWDKIHFLGLVWPWYHPALVKLVVFILIVGEDGASVIVNCDTTDSNLIQGLDLNLGQTMYVILSYTIHKHSFYCIHHLLLMYEYLPLPLYWSLEVSFSNVRFSLPRLWIITFNLPRLSSLHFALKTQLNLGLNQNI